MRFTKSFFFAFAAALVAFSSAPTSAPSVEGGYVVDTNGDGKGDTIYTLRDQENNIVAI